MILFGIKQNHSEEICLVNMKTTKGYSQLTVSLGIISVLLMLTGSTMAAPVQFPSMTSLILTSKTLISHYTFQLSRLVGETQADFAKERLGDKDFDGYVHKTPGLPSPTWDQSKIPEEKLLKMEVEELFLFKALIVEIKTHEALNKSSQFTASFQQIEDDINYEISNIQQLQLLLGFTITRPTSSPQPTHIPATTQKEQDEWELSVLKELLLWLIPVQDELHRQLTTA
ncbi:hypothetical protein OS493_005735 [Desmophyllum pertusum]|uniref:Uncharacterized protein n=1 Tax=Desmophyllum pertusum TaxID=174260 RepID=A0A9W9YFL0_9CNID|nr:hypothetical protein OS493_005735 [Desmophyllum pertusum]